MTYYFRDHAGRKVEATSVQEISRLAQREANKFHVSVQVHTASGRKSHRKVSMARNPSGGAWAPYHHTYEWLTPAAGKRALKAIRERHDDTPASHFKLVKVGPEGQVSVYRKNPVPTLEGLRWAVGRPSARAAPKARPSKLAGKRAPYFVQASKGGKVATHKLLNKAQADQVADAYRAQGHTVSVMRRNPATKASKARKSAAHKRGCYVEYSYGSGTPKERIKCGNRGIATIRANELKRSGAKGVKIVGA